MAWPYKQANTGTEKKEERWSHRAERGTASLQHCPCYLSQPHKVQFKSTCLCKFFCASPKKYYSTSHHIPAKSSSFIQLLNPDSPRLKKSLHGRLNIRHTQGKTLRPSHPTTFTPVSELKVMLAKALMQQPHQAVQTPHSYCPLQTCYSISDGCLWWPKEGKSASLIKTGSEAENSTIPRMHTLITKAFNVPNIPPLHILLQLSPQSTTPFQ